MWSNGNSFNGSSNFGASVGSAIGAGTIRWPVPRWKLGLRLIDDRGGM